MKKNIIEVVKGHKRIIVAGLLAVGGTVGAFVLGKALIAKNSDDDAEDDNNVIYVDF